MRNILKFIILFACFSCAEPIDHPPVVMYKSHLTEMNNPLPACLCRYYYKQSNAIMAAIYSFNDSCGKYNIGDTIIGRRRK